MSGPILDRFDLQVAISPVEADVLIKQAMVKTLKSFVTELNLPVIFNKFDINKMVFFAMHNYNQN